MGPEGKSSLANHCSILSDGSYVPDTRWQFAGKEGAQSPPSEGWVCQVIEARRVGAASKRVAVATGAAVVVAATGVPFGLNVTVGTAMIGALILVPWVMIGHALDQARAEGVRAAWLYPGDAFVGHSGSEKLNKEVQEALGRANLTPQVESLMDPAAAVDGAWGFGESSMIFNEPAGREGYRRLMATCIGVDDLETLARAKGAILEELQARAFSSPDGASA